MCIRDRKRVDSYKYLDVMVTKDGTSVTEIKHHIGQGKQMTRRLYSTSWRNILRPESKIRIYETIV